MEPPFGAGSNPRVLSACSSILRASSARDGRPGVCARNRSAPLSIQATDTGPLLISAAASHACTASTGRRR